MGECRRLLIGRCAYKWEEQAVMVDFVAIDFIDFSDALRMRSDFLWKLVVNITWRVWGHLFIRQAHLTSLCVCNFLLERFHQFATEMSAQLLSATLW